MITTKTFHSSRRSSRAYYRRQKPSGLKSLVVLLSLAAAVLCIYNLATGLPPATYRSAKIDLLTQSPATIDWPNYGNGAIGAVGIDGVLASYGDQSPKPIASLTKVITSLVVLDEKPLADGADGPSIMMTQADLDLYNLGISQGAAVKPVVVGSSLTQRQMLQAILLPSAANYSESLAVWAFGSKEAYLAAASTWLAAHKLNQTTVVDTSGIDAGNVSTPSDLVEIAKLALANPSLASIVATGKADIPGVGEISNTNSILGQSGVNGIKTGSTDEAGICMLYSSTVSISGNDITMVGAILGGGSRAQENDDIIRIIGDALAGLKYIDVVSTDQDYGSYSTAWGQHTDLVALENARVLVWSDTPVSVSIKPAKFTSVESGTSAGTAVVKIGDKVTKYPLYASESIAEPWVIFRLTHLF